jgi:hypothetical protein
MCVRPAKEIDGFLIMKIGHKAFIFQEPLFLRRAEESIKSVLARLGELAFDDDVIDGSSEAEASEEVE